MRTADLGRLSEPYHEDADPPDSAVAAALGVKLPHWTALEADILADFHEELRQMLDVGRNHRI